MRVKRASADFQDIFRFIFGHKWLVFRISAHFFGFVRRLKKSVYIKIAKSAKVRKEQAKKMCKM